MESRLNPIHDTDELSPLLTSDRQRIHRASADSVSKFLHGSSPPLYKARRSLQWFLTSKYGHYFVFILVSLDVAGIFANFLISLHVCEHGRKGENVKGWKSANSALGILSLVFSCLFMTELALSIFAFGLAYFRSAFHVFDSMSIVASFLVDVLTHGPLEEAGSLVIVLRLFRVFKIIEESGTAAEETLSEMKQRIDELEKQNASLRLRSPITA